MLVTQLAYSYKLCLKILLAICDYLPEYTYFAAVILSIKGIIAWLNKKRTVCHCLWIGLDCEREQIKLAEALKYIML